MFESFSVAATFSIRNMASPVLSTLIREVRALKTEAIGAQAALAEMTKGVGIGNLTKRVTALQDALAKTAATSAEIRGSMAADFDAVGAGLMIAARNARELAAAMGEVQAASRMAAGAGAAVGGGGGRGGNTAHLHGSVPLGAGTALRMGGPIGTAAIVAGAAAGAGLMFGAEEQQSIMFALMGANINPGNSRYNALAQELKNKTEAAASGTIFSYQEAATILPSLVSGLLQREDGTGTSIDKVSPLINPTLKFAETMSMFSKATGKNWGEQESVEAATRWAHLNNQYSPEGYNKGLNVLAPVAMATGQSPMSMVTAGKYIFPTANSIGFDPTETAMMIGLMSNLGQTGSTAGTGLRQLLSGIEKQNGPGGSVANSIAAALGFGSKGNRSSERTKLLRELGFIDSSGGNTINSFDDLVNVAQADREKYGKRLFGMAQGAFTSRGTTGFMALSSENAGSLWAAEKERIGGFVGNDMFQNLAAQGSTAQQWHQFVANLENVVNSLTTNSGALGVLTESLKSINAFLLKFDTSFHFEKGPGGLPGWLGKGDLWNGAGGSHSINLPMPPHISAAGVPDYLKPVGQRGEIIHHGNNVFHINGKDAKSVADEVMMRLNKSLGMSMLSNQGDGDGIMHSPFSSGSGP